MDNTALVKEITNAFCENGNDPAVVQKYFAPNFVHVGNGKRSDLSAYLARLAEYQRRYTRFRIAAWDELFTVDDKVVVSYTLEAEKGAGPPDRMAVMAIWQLKDGKVIALREVDALV
jgi:hypothetical protein